MKTIILCLALISIAAAQRPAPQKAQAELHWKPKFTEIDVIVRTAWDWRRAHPRGYRATSTHS